MAASSTKDHLVDTVPVPFDLDDAMMMPEDLEATAQTVNRLVSDMPMVGNATGNCSVCMESLWPSEGSCASKQVSCGHVYHRDCITDWFLKANSYSCPLCRHQIS